jgi:hypothetical protein
LVNWRGDSNNKDFAVSQIVKTITVAEMNGIFQLLGRALQGVVMARLKVCYALGIDIKA